MVKQCLFIMVFSLACLLSLKAFAQTKSDYYERLQHLYEYQYSQNWLAEAYQSAERSLAYKPRQDWSSDDFLVHAEANVYKGKPHDVPKDLELAVLYGCSIEDVKADTIFKRILTPALLAKLKEAETKYKKNANTKYLAELQQIDSLDQAIRSDSAMKTWATPVVFHQVDSTNFYRFLKLVAQYGLPDKRKNGIDFPYLVLLLHASVTSDTLYAQVLAFLEQTHETEYVFKSGQALIIDRHRNFVEQKDQRFGYWAFSLKPPKLENYEDVDAQRFRYNMVTFGDQCREYNQKIPETYKPAAYPAHYFGK